MSTNSIPGFISKPSPHSVPETIQRLCALLKSKGVAMFALIDHSGEAEKAGLNMRPTQLLIFGNPKAGTPLMLAAPSTAIDLPLKALIWEDADGKSGLATIRPITSSSATGFPPTSKRISLQSSLSLLKLLPANSRCRERTRKETRASNLLLLQSYWH